MNISDAILVYGNCKTSHDENLKAVLSVLTRLKEKDLTLNYNKCEFNTDVIVLWSYILKRWFISRSSKNLCNKNCSAPNNIDEVRSLFGIAKYVSSCIRVYSIIAEPIRRLMKSKTELQ